ncbi:MAG: hypothetical protein M1839_000276 [Geoglossum umbratile]|nr:MAG: hypothetical protein M1839_000276 [Geoglossum umbratile]
MSSPPIEHPPEGKRANRETQAEVDIMILDYLLYMAAKQTIGGRKAERSGVANCGSSRGNGSGEFGASSPADVSMTMVDSFLPLFKANHPSQPIPELVQSRLHLLKFTTLFVHRLQRTPTTPPLPSLTQLRTKNHLRAAAWLSHHPPIASTDPFFTPFTTTSPQNNLPLPPATLHQNRQHVLTYHHPSQPYSPHYGTPSSLSLRDTLPQFMELSAYITSTYKSGRVNETWEKMAAEYMLQAALEAYLVYGEQGDGPLRECFAWGFDESDEEGVLVNAMFWDEEEEVMQKWMGIRGEHLRAVRPPLPSITTKPPFFILLNLTAPPAQLIPPPTASTIQSHLESVAARFPLFRFEGKLLDFLWALTRHDTVPTLVQLESGVLDGFSREETEALSLKVGIRN